jgi:CubicO group peptidase (beta-lactamase class C family)
VKRSQCLSGLLLFTAHIGKFFLHEEIDMKLKSLILLFFIVITSFVKAQTAEADLLIRNFMKTWNIQGGAVAITKNGKLIYSKGFGYTDKRKRRAAKPDDLYRIASVSKPITSIAIMKLIEEGKLALTDTVFGEGKILDAPYYSEVISDKRIYDITVQQLLEHTAGWDRNTKCDGYSHFDPAFFPLHVADVEHAPNPVGDSTLIRFCLEKGLNHVPGNTFSYSNVGYLVLGKIIEKASGMPYENYVKTHIFQPLSIHDIHLGKNLAADKFKRETEYFGNSSTLSCYGDGSRVPWQYGGFNLEAMNAHGGWVASAPDLTKLILAVDGLEMNPDILSAASIKCMGTSSDANSHYAKGWSVNKNNNWWHTGSLDGTATFVCKTNNGYTWAFLFNSRANNSDAFWAAFDRLPWQCIATMPETPSISLQ